MQSTGWWVALGGLANCAWIFLWQYEHFVWTVAAMLILLASLIVVYLRSGSGGQGLHRRDLGGADSVQHLPGLDHGCHGGRHQRRAVVREVEPVWHQRGAWMVVILARC